MQLDHIHEIMNMKNSTLAWIFFWCTLFHERKGQKLRFYGFIPHFMTYFGGDMSKSRFMGSDIEFQRVNGCSEKTDTQSSFF